MKIIDPTLLVSQSLCYCLRVERLDGVIALFTSTDHDVTVNTGDADYDGIYLAAVGLDVSNLVSQAGQAVDNMELTVFPDETTYPQVDIVAGRWDGGKFKLFETDYLDPTNINLLKRGTTGEASTVLSANRFEFRGLKQALQQQLGAVTSKTCRYRLFSTEMPHGLCMVDPAPWTHTYLVTAVGSRRQFTCSAAVEVDDYYGEGTALANDGENAGYRQKIKSFAAGVFTLSLPMPFDITIGDEFEVQAGCRHRLTEDCKDKFDNVLNFGGEPHIPGPDLLTADPETSA